MLLRKWLFAVAILFCLSACQNQQTQEIDQNKPDPGNILPDNPMSFVGKDYLIDDQHSYLGFKIKYFGFSPVRGRFDEFDGTMFYDEKDLTTLSITVLIDVNSINTGNDRRDDDLKKEDTWFNAPEFPIASFNSKSVMPRDDGGFDLTGDFTIKGITKEETVKFEKPTAISRDWAGNEQVDFSGKLTINRQDYKIFGGDFWSSVMENGLTQLSDDVEIELDMHCRRADYQARYEDSDSSDMRKIVLDEIKRDGIETGLALIDSYHKKEELSAGKLSSIGSTLNTWGMHEQAKAVFNKRLEYFPDKFSTWTMLGITDLLLGKTESAEQHFKTALKKEPINAWPTEYLRLIERMKKNKANSI